MTCQARRDAYMGDALTVDCPQCGARAGARCRDLTSGAKRKPTRAEPHIARRWVDVHCPKCEAWPGDRCLTPSGHDAAAVHAARIRAVPR